MAQFTTQQLPASFSSGQFGDSYMNAKKFLRVSLALLAIFMIFFPPIRLFLEWQKGTLILSLPLPLMFVCGLFALRLAFYKRAWID